MRRSKGIFRNPGLAAVTSVAVLGMGVTAEALVPVSTEEHTEYLSFTAWCPEDTAPQLDTVFELGDLNGVINRGRFVIHCAAPGSDENNGQPRFESVDFSPTRQAKPCPDADSNAQEYVFKLDYTERNHLWSGTGGIPDLVERPDGVGELDYFVRPLDSFEDVTAQASCGPPRPGRISLD